MMMILQKFENKKNENCRVCNSLRRMFEGLQKGLGKKEKKGEMQVPRGHFYFSTLCHGPAIVEKR